MADSGTPKPQFKIRLKLNPQIQAAIRSDGAVPAAPSPASPSLPSTSSPGAGGPPKGIKLKKPSTPKPKPPKQPKVSTPASSTPSTSTPIRLTPSSAFTSRAPSPAPPPQPNAIASGSGYTPFPPSIPTSGEPLGPPPVPSQPGSDAPLDGDGTDPSQPGTPMSGSGDPFVKGRGKGPKKPRIGADGRPLVAGRVQLPLKEVCEKMIKEVRRRDDYAFFLNPVNEAEVPGYGEVVTEPMSLVTMEEKLGRGQYRDFDSFEYDMRLIFTNCKAFNPPDTMFHQMATKLQNWVIKHLPTNRALVLPPALVAASPSPSPAPSVRSARTPSIEPSSPAVSASGRTASGGQVKVPGPHKGTGQNQLGKKRGPYKKSRDAVMTAAPVVHQEVMGGTDESGKPRGTGLVDFEPGMLQLVKWWETQGRRIKTKKEIAKLSTHPDFVHTLTDSSFNLAELESLTPMLNAFLLRPAQPPGLLPLPADFLASPASNISRPPVAQTAARLPTQAPSQGNGLLLNPSYGTIAHDALLPPAFSWRRARPSTSSTSSSANTPTFVAPLPRSSVASYNPDPFAYFALDKYPVLDALASAPQPGYILEDPYRPAEVQDYGAYPSIHSSTSGPQAHDHASAMRFLVPPLPEAPTFFDPLLDESVPGGGAAMGGGAGAKAAMLRCAKAETTLRDGMYGSHTAEAYAASVERFLEEAVGGREGEGEGDDKAEVAREWVEREVVRGVFGLGGLAVGRAVGEGWARREEMMDEEEEEEEEAEEEGEAEEEAVEEPQEEAMDGVLDQTALDTAMVAKEEPIGMDDEDIKIPPAPPTPAPPPIQIDPRTSFPVIPQPNPRLLSRLATRSIRSLPSRRTELAHLAIVRSQPISLPTLLHKPEDWEATVPPPVPTASKRKRSSSTTTKEVPAAADEAELGGGSGPPGSAVWVKGVMAAVGKELAEVAKEQESAGAVGGATGGRRGTRSAKAKEVGGGDDTEDERLRRVRFLLISLAKWVPVQELEKMNAEQMELIPAGQKRAKYAGLLLR